MAHRATKHFWHCYDALSAEVQKVADENHEILEADPRHPSLHYKKIGRFWSVRVGAHHRALAVEDGEDTVWFWIGNHAEYDRLLKDAY